MSLAKKLKQAIESGAILSSARGKILINVFYEPSTRTSCSFQSAMLRLGGETIVVNDVTNTSVSKGESLNDTIRSLNCYGDVIVMRHPTKGSVDIAASCSDIPIINAGDGIGEHPTQALLDLFTIFSESPASFSSILEDSVDSVDSVDSGDSPTPPTTTTTTQSEVNKTVITMVGDLKHGRTVHSLVKLLALYPRCTLNYISPSTLAIPDEIRDYIHRANISAKSDQDFIQQNNNTQSLSSLLPLTDILYVTRVQKERFNSIEEYNDVKDEYIITKKLLDESNVKSNLKILHPLPRVNEITTDVDETSHAAYFRQMKNGVWVRMALLCISLGITTQIEVELATFFQ